MYYLYYFYLGIRDCGRNELLEVSTHGGGFNLSGTDCHSYALNYKWAIPLNVELSKFLLQGGVWWGLACWKSTGVLPSLLHYLYGF